VHVTGAGPVVFPVTALQSVSSLAAGAGIRESDASRTTQHVNGLEQLFPARREANDVVPVFVITRQQCTTKRPACEKQMPGFFSGGSRRTADWSPAIILFA